MKHIFFLFLITQFVLSGFSQSQWTGNATPTYPEIIAQYQKWDKEHAEIQLFNMGKSDAEFPLYVCIINGGKDSVSTFQKARNSTTVLINNAIHSGEPDGVNASMIWIQNWINTGKSLKNLPVIAIIPAYNVGGMLNRSGTSRTNQNGPEEYGFRGNAQNLDLNRDFIKMDSENAKTFAVIFQALDVDVFVDNHVSNGADYQYTLTLITSLKERLAPSMREMTYSNYLPDFTKSLNKKGWDWSNYVETKADIPDSGIVAFNDLPRYAMGYASLFHAMSFTVETHMLKPFPARVQATLAYLEHLINWSGKNTTQIELARKEAIRFSLNQSQFHFNYAVTDQHDSIPFKGYKAVYKTSEISGQNRLSYDRNQPFEKRIPFYNEYVSQDSIRIPAYYLVATSANLLIEKLKQNNVEMELVNCDSMATIQIKITDFETGKRPYEGHYLHSKTRSEEVQATVFSNQVYRISTNQSRRNFIVSVLEPRAEDSYFAWNFMDSYIQEKEYFSDYVFEDEAPQILKNDPQLAQDFLSKKRTDPEFASNGAAQLFFIYQRSAHFETKTFNRLPIYKVY